MNSDLPITRRHNGIGRIRRTIRSVYAVACIAIAFTQVQVDAIEGSAPGPIASVVSPSPPVDPSSATLALQRLSSKLPTIPPTITQQSVVDPVASRMPGKKVGRVPGEWPKNEKILKVPPGIPLEKQKHFKTKGRKVDALSSGSGNRKPIVLAKVTDASIETPVKSLVTSSPKATPSTQIESQIQSPIDAVAAEEARSVTPVPPPMAELPILGDAHPNTNTDTNSPKPKTSESEKLISTPIGAPVASPNPITTPTTSSVPQPTQPKPTSKSTKKPRAAIHKGQIVDADTEKSPAVTVPSQKVPIKDIEQKLPVAIQQGQIKESKTKVEDTPEPVAIPVSSLASTSATGTTTSIPVDQNAKLRDKVMSNRQKLKDKSTAALHSSSKTKQGNATQLVSDGALPTLNITLPQIEPAKKIGEVTAVDKGAVVDSPSQKKQDQVDSSPSLDLTHLDGDKDIIRSTSGGSWLSSAWMPMHGAFFFILIFTLSCVKRIVSAYRASSDPSASNLARRTLASLLSQLSSLGWEKKDGVDSPMSTDRTRELASLAFEDGKSRRRGVKAGMGTKANVQAQDIEMQSLTASLASMHIPKMIYLPSGENNPDGVSPLAATCILTPQRLQLLLPYLPATSHIQDLALKYSLSVCGASISDLYRRCGKMQDAITVIQDSAGYIFGCYVSSPWKIHDSYYGNANSFVFTLHPHFHVYPSTNANSFYQLATKDSIALGGGDHFAIWLDDAFRKGQSKTCQTFGSPSLSSEEEFRCHELEVWSFVDGQW